MFKSKIVICHLFVIWVLSFGILISGCAVIKETTRGFLGNSTKILEEKRKDAAVLSVEKDYFTCYHKVLDILKERKSYIYTKRSDLIAFYVSEDDTTAVGIFFKEIDKQKTQIEISSPSTSAKEIIAKEIFSSFE
jgi:hypothetical protein